MKLPASRSMSWKPRFSSRGTSGASRAARICSRDQRGPLALLRSCGERVVIVFSPVGLKEDAVDVLEVHDAGLVADGFDEGAEAEVAGAAKDPFARADDQRQGFGGEGVVAKAGAVELIQDEQFDGFWRQT